MHNILISMYILDIIGIIDPIFSTVSANVLCAYEHLLGTDWQCRNGNDPYGRLYYISSGSGHLTHHGRDYKLRSGKFFLIPAHTTYSYDCPHQIVIKWVHFTATLSGGMDLFAYILCNNEIIAIDKEEIVSSMSRLRVIWMSDRPGDYIETTGLLLQLLAMFLHTADSESYSTKFNELHRFKPVLEYIDQNLSSPIKLTTLAKLVHLELSYFSRLFTQHFKVSPIRYVLSQRVKKSQVLLWQTHRTLESIGSELGFTDEFHFSRTFKNIAGITPIQYRRQTQHKRP